jgi:hypothetical protein
MTRIPGSWLLPLVVVGLGGMTSLHAACCYFTAKNADITQPAQKVFLTWAPDKKLETFTVQPKFEGNALDFGMVIPTPSRPKLHEMPRDFFKSLAVYTILKRREFPVSTLLSTYEPRKSTPLGLSGSFYGQSGRSRVKVLESGLVGSLDYKILQAGRADDLYQWLKDNHYRYDGDEATLDFYVQKEWVFTVMKIDTMQMKKGPDGTFTGDVTPTRFQFTSEKLVYPLRITQLSIKDRTEALFYVQAPFKVDLPGDFSYQYQWVPMLQAASGCTPGGLPGQGEDWLKAIKDETPALLRRGQELGFPFVAGQRPLPNRQGRTPTTLEWAKRLTAQDLLLFKGEALYSEKVPDVDDGFTPADVKDPKKAEAVFKVIRERLEKYRKERPLGYLVREAPAEDVRQLQLLAGHLQVGQFITKFRKIFTRAEMNGDLELVPARQGNSEDRSEYEEAMPTSPP